MLRRNPAIHDPGDFEVIEDDTGSSDTSYTDTDVEPETKYVYRVQARNAHGWSSRSKNVRTTTPAEPTSSEERDHNNPPWQGHGDLLDIETNLQITFGPNNLSPEDPEDQVRREWWYKLDSLAPDSVHFLNRIASHAGVITFEIYDAAGDKVMLNGSAIGQDKYLYFMPEIFGDYRLRVTAASDGYAFVKYRNETPNGSKSDRSGRDCTGSEFVHINDCQIDAPDTDVDGRAHSSGSRRQHKSGHVDQDYDVYKIFLRRGTGYKACVDSTESGWLSLWVSGLGNYSSAFKVNRPPRRLGLPLEWWVSSKPVCTNVNPKITGPHWLHAKVGELRSNRGSVVSNTALDTYEAWYEVR